MPASRLKPAWAAMILLRTITVGLILRNRIRKRSMMPTPARVAFDWM